MTAKKFLTENRSFAEQTRIQALVQKWNPLLEGIKKPETRSMMAVLFENQSQHLKSMTEETRTANVGNFMKFVFPVLRRVWPNLIANEIVSIQPMTAPIGGIFYYDLKYGTTKGSVTAGQKLVKDFNPYYSSEKIDVEVIGSGAATSFTSSLDFTPVRPSTVTVTAIKGSDDSVMTGTDNGQGVIVGSGVSGSVDYDTGAISVQFAAATKAGETVKASYSYNTELNSNIPQVNIDIQIQEIKATTRKLKAKWSTEASDDLKALQGIDAEAEVVSGIAAEIALELDREIIEELRVGAMGYSGTFNAGTVSPYHTQVEHYRNLITELSKASNKIHKNSMRGPANFIVTSPEVSSILEQLETHGDFRPIFNAPNADTLAPVEQPHSFGVQKFGTVASKWVAYKDPYFPVSGVTAGSMSGDILIGYKGQTAVDAGYVWAPYIPLQSTSTFLNPEDFSYVKGLRTRYAKKLVRPEFFATVKVTNM